MEVAASASQQAESTILPLVSTGLGRQQHPGVVTLEAILILGLVCLIAPAQPIF